MTSNIIDYYGSRIEVSVEVADFMESERRRKAAQERSARRHLTAYADMDEFRCSARFALENLVIRQMEYEELHHAIALLPEEERYLLYLKYEKELSMEQMGQIFGISKMAVSKRHKKILCTLNNLLCPKLDNCNNI